MNLWDSLFHHAPHLKHHGHLAGTGRYSTHVEGENEYQDALELVAGGRTEEAARLECTAFLIPEPEGPDGETAIAVHVSGCKIGTLNREQAQAYAAFLAHGLDRIASCDALIYGGWRRNGGEGAFQVRLDLAWPPRLQEDLPEPPDPLAIEPERP